MTVEVVFATTAEQWIKRLTVPVGSTAREVIERSGLYRQFPGLESHKVGVYSRSVDVDDVVTDGDRIEIYRPLTADPKTVRRQLAKEGKTMGRKR